MSEAISIELLRQRIRNRMIEVLDLTAAIPDQLAYQEKVPFIYVPHEVINQWEDWLTPKKDENGQWNIVLDCWPTTFTPEEAAALHTYHQAWETASDAFPGGTPALIDLANNPIWRRLSEAAAAALAVMMVRGEFSDEELHEV